MSNLQDAQFNVYRQGIFDLINLYEIAAEYHYHKQIERGDVGQYHAEGIKYDLCSEIAAKLCSLEIEVGKVAQDTD